jgi:hypothetical protein
MLCLINSVQVILSIQVTRNVHVYVYSNESLAYGNSDIKFICRNSYALYNLLGSNLVKNEKVVIR